jgi:hypothetical protein
MELGIDKKQIEGAKKFFMGLSKDRVMLRFVICLTILVVGYFVVLDPQATGLAEARDSLVGARKQDRRATDLVFYTHQLEAYEPFLFPDAHPLTLQEYVLEKVQASGASVRGMANKKTESKGVFKVSELELTATGTYSQLVDLVDRLERGDKIVRLEKCRLLGTKTQIILDCSVKGLVKSGGGSSQAPGEAQEVDEAAGNTGDEAMDATAEQADESPEGTRP